MRYVDFRSVTARDAETALRQLGDNGACITAWQLAAMEQDTWKRAADRLIITAPDFLNYARLLSTGQAMTLARLPGGLAKSVASGALAGFSSLRKLNRLAKMDFWSVAEVLLRYDLALLPAAFEGPVCLHSHLTDFACVFEREDFVKTFFRLMGRQAGVHTQQLPMALTCLSKWQLSPAVVSFLCSTGDVDGSAALQSARITHTFSSAVLIAEMDSWPTDMQKQSNAEQEYGTVLNGIVAAPMLQL